MASINPNRYPVDYTGIAASNAVVNESVTLTTRQVRVFVPQNAPYFKNSMVIKDVVSGNTLTSSQWKAFYLVSTASAKTDLGNEVYAVVANTDQSVSNNLQISYQTVGGDYITSYDNINQMLLTLTQDNRPVSWPNVLGQQGGFNPNQHFHSLSDTIGWEYLITYIEQLKMVILLGDSLKKDQVLAYIDTALASSNAIAASVLSGSSPFGQHVNNTANPHGVTAAQLNLGNVMNYRVATLAEAQAGVATNLYVTVDQVAAVVKNAVNLGMDAHIARTDNPHGVTPTQLNLGLIQNLGTATLSDLNTPVQGSPKYVINTVLGQYMTNFFATQQQSIATSFSTVNASIASVTTQANTATTQAQAAQSAAQQAVTQNTNALNAATDARSVADENRLSIQNALSTVTTQFDTYVAQAIQMARDVGYNAGYTAGLAAR